MEVRLTKDALLSFKKEFSLYPLYAIPRWFRDAHYSIKWAFQRLFRGYDDRWKWGLNFAFSDVAVECLESMISNNHSYPITCKNESEWIEILTCIKEGFEAFQLIANRDYIYKEKGKVKVNKMKLRELQEKQKMGLELFAQHYGNLWD